MECFLSGEKDCLRSEIALFSHHMDAWHVRKAARENRLPITVPTELVIFIVFGLAYFLTCALRFSGYGDEAYRTALNLIRYHTFALNGRVGIIDSLFAVPFALLGYWGINSRFAGSLYYVFFSALTCVVFHRFSFEVYGNRQISILLTLMLGFATQIWVYSKIGMEPVMTFLLLLSVYFVHRSSRLDWLLGGCFLGFTILSKMNGIMAVPILLAYAYFISPRDWRRMLLIVAPSTAGLLTSNGGGAFLVGLLLVPFSTINIPFYEGLYAFLLSPGKSIFLFNPPIVLAFFALRRFRLAHKAEFALWLTALAVFLGFFSLIWFGSGDDVWGPRYMTEILPIVILPAGLVIDQLRHPTLGIRRLRICVTLLVALGLFVQVLGLAFPYEWHPVLLRDWGLYSMDLATFTPALSHIVFNFTLLMSTLSRILTGKSLEFVFLKRTDIAHMPTTLSFDLSLYGQLDFPVFARHPLLACVGFAVVVFLVFMLLEMARNDREV